jgi:hypothetical protein
MAKKITILLPAGTAIWPKLNEVDVYQPVDKKGRPNGAEKRRFLTRIKFNDEDHRKVDAYLKKVAKDVLGDEDAKLPWKKDKKTGELHLEATSGEKYRPPVWDAKNRAVPDSVIIGGGSTIRLDVTVNAYEGFGGGINLYINAVQLLDLKQSARGKSSFEEAEGFSYTGDDDADEDKSPFDPHSDSAGEDYAF